MEYSVLRADGHGPRNDVQDLRVVYGVRSLTPGIPSSKQGHDVLIEADPPVIYSVRAELLMQSLTEYLRHAEFCSTWGYSGVSSAILCVLHGEPANHRSCDDLRTICGDAVSSESSPFRPGIRKAVVHDERNLQANLLYKLSGLATLCRDLDLSSAVAGQSGRAHVQCLYTYWSSTTDGT
ncbi:hypothetical protein BDV18DRAFT_116752 [Aspergillus unguis]